MQPADTNPQVFVNFRRQMQERARDTAIFHSMQGLVSDLRRVEIEISSIEWSIDEQKEHEMRAEDITVFTEKKDRLFDKQDQLRSRLRENFPADTLDRFCQKLKLPFALNNVVDLVTWLDDRDAKSVIDEMYPPIEEFTPLRVEEVIGM